MKMSANEYKELERFLFFLQDKVEDCYANETQKAIERFLKDVKK